MIKLKSLLTEDTLKPSGKLVVYHSFYGNFDINRYNFTRGLFAITPWWVGMDKYEKYDAFTPNEFGDKVVALELEVNPTKTIVADDQFDLVEKNFHPGRLKDTIIDNADLVHSESSWQSLDTTIGKFCLKRGFNFIHYTDDQMYGDVYVILDKGIIKKYWFKDKIPHEL